MRAKGLRQVVGLLFCPTKSQLSRYQGDSQPFTDIFHTCFRPKRWYISDFQALVGSRKYLRNSFLCNSTRAPAANSHKALPWNSLDRKAMAKTVVVSKPSKRSFLYELCKPWMVKDSKKAVNRITPGIPFARVFYPGRMCLPFFSSKELEKLPPLENRQSLFLGYSKKNLPARLRYDPAPAGSRR